ncbi:hypothetical protein NDU88_001967 [Pleurodeles waltl]|uniref:Uncharacterized protein n=1 Tax=Pleurodeles waltl TaxID=8319 RepID=A0AAV7U8N7_PLEWA|nr:hypothetical protein NDU88_001967 [Pleurodeles waltl]
MGARCDWWRLSPMGTGCGMVRPGAESLTGCGCPLGPWQASGTWETGALCGGWWLARGPRGTQRRSESVLTWPAAAVWRGGDGLRIGGRSGDAPGRSGALEGQCAGEWTCRRRNWWRRPPWLSIRSRDCVGPPRVCSLLEVSQLRETIAL